MKEKYRKSHEYLNRALKSVPLGSQTFSKSKTQFPVGVSPFFATHGKGAYVWDVDGNRYIDFMNGLLSITIGHCDKDIVNSVKQQLDKGTIFSLANELEFKVAEQIIEMVPCAEMVRFGKNGSDATSGAIRLARAYTKRDHIMICGYHGWQDWYIGSTSRWYGVPESTRKLTHTFTYNDIDSLKTLLNEYKDQTAAIILEPANMFPPKDDFLNKVRELATNRNILLIFDETITGFRFSIGGAQQYYDVVPDLATFGKGLANGYPLSAIAGKEKYMKMMEEIFFSFTFGGETLSLAAANTVLNKLKKDNVLESIAGVGNYLIDQLSHLITENNLNHIFSVEFAHPSWSFLAIKDTDKVSSWQLKTLLVQEMFANGIISIGTHNMSFSHTNKHIEELMKAYKIFFEIAKKGIEEGNISNYLQGEMLQPLFKVR